MASKNRAGIEFLVKSIAGIALTILLLFLPAGTLDWRAGWAYVIVYVLVIYGKDRRLRPGPDRGTQPAAARRPEGLGQSALRRLWDDHGPGYPRPGGLQCPLWLEA